MPKKKQQPKNSYYFFMVDKKRELESRGHRFPGGMRDIAAMEDIRQEWKELDLNTKAGYEDQAKEAKQADKLNMDNKFTCSGESYADRARREEEARKEAEFVNRLLMAATRDTDELDSRCFVLFNAIHTCEVDFPDTKYWPVELAIAAFNFEIGLVNKWWTLVDTHQVPIGYASYAKEKNEMTCLPIPGSPKFKPEHGNYFKILNTIRAFIKKHVQPFEGFYAVFTMPDVQKSAEGCILWLLDNAEFESREQRLEMDDFIRHLKFLRTPALLLKLAVVARRRDPTYAAAIGIYDLENAAMDVLGRGDYDYLDNITCAFHNQEDESIKMQMCALNIVLRSIFIILKELVIPMGMAPNNRHRVGCVLAPKPYHSFAAETSEQNPAPTNDTEPSAEMLDAWSGGGRSSDVPSPPKMAKSDEFPKLDEAAAGLSSGGGGYGRSAKQDDVGSGPWNTGSGRGRRIGTAAKDEAPNLGIDEFPTLGSWPGMGRGSLGRGRTGGSRGGY